MSGGKGHRVDSTPAGELPPKPAKEESRGRGGAPHRGQAAGVLRVLPSTNANYLLIPESWTQVRNNQFGNQ